MSVKTNQAYAYWLLPVNATGIPGEKSTPRPLFILGADGTTDDGPPPEVFYEPFSSKYGILSLRDIRTEENYNVEGVVEIHCIVMHIDEIYSDLYAELAAAMDDTTDPVTVAVTLNEPDDPQLLPIPDSHKFSDGCYVVIIDETRFDPPQLWDRAVETRLMKAVPASTEDTIIYIENPAGFPQIGLIDLRFEGSSEVMQVQQGAGTDTWLCRRGIYGTTPTNHAAGTKVVWYGPAEGLPPIVPVRSYECCQLVSGATGSSWELKRAFDGVPPGQAHFNSFVTPHDAGRRVYKLHEKHFTLKVRRDAVTIDSAGFRYPDQFDMVLPAASAVAELVSLQNYHGYGPWKIVNTAAIFSDTDKDLPPAPGVRTLSGQAYLMPFPGEAEVRANAATPLLIQDNAPLRCVYAYVQEAPTGAPLRIRVKYRKGPSAEWLEIQELTIAAGELYSYQGDNTPAMRKMPYGIDWPPPVMLEDFEISYDILEVGSLTPGVDLMVVVQT